MELKSDKHTVRCSVPSGAKVPGHCQEQLTQNLDCALADNALVLTVPKIGGAWAPLTTLPPSSEQTWHQLEDEQEDDDDDDDLEDLSEDSLGEGNTLWVFWTRRN